MIKINKLRTFFFNLKKPIKKLSFLLILVFSQFLFSQDKQEYFGALKLNDSVAIPYKIIFEVQGDSLSGYSVTDFGGDHETKSNIKGLYNKDEKTISFYEEGIVFTKSTFIENDFCFVHVESTKFKLDRTKSFKTNFYGKFSDGTKCIDGEIFLNEVERVEKAITKISRKVERTKKIDEDLKEKFRNTNIMDSLKLNILKKDQTTTFFTENDYVELSLYDSWEVDGDIISVKKDNLYVLKSYNCKKEKKTLKLDLKNQVTRLVIKSESVGLMGLNTTRIEINDFKGNEIDAITELDKDQVTLLNIVKL